jgi:spore maturation protein CgeB
MRVVLFYHSLRSDWNNGTAHFLRGVVRELIRRGHEAFVYEPANAWSVDNLLRDHGPRPISRFYERYPGLSSVAYDPARLDLDHALDKADLVLVHEWNEPTLVGRIGAHRARARSYRLFFHDTHHRALTAPDVMRGYDLSNYDGVLAFGEILRQIYALRDSAPRAHTWHEAADVAVFSPIPDVVKTGDLVWIGNWGDEERSVELKEFLLEPVATARPTIRAVAYGVRYPRTGREALRRAGVDYRGFLPNYDVPSIFAAHRVTIHVPRRPYARALVGIPTIRVFEALASGIPLVSAPWSDVEGLFKAGLDYLSVSNGAAMRSALQAVLHDKELARQLAEHGLRTILKRHTCAHRVDELLAIYRLLEPARSTP